MSISVNKEQFIAGRLRSLDFFRGLTMFLLIAEFTELFSWLTDESLEGSFIYAIGMQFHHHPWAGLRFWDLIQPFFMFIVGVAIPLSVANRRRRGQTEKQIRRHVWQRALILLLLGWGLYVVAAGHMVFRFQNVLAQLAFTYLVAYLIMDKPAIFQVLFSLALIIITEILYRTFPIEGFNQAFEPNLNFGTWLDLQYGGEDLNGSWVSFNAVPTAAHTIWGVLTGQLLMSQRHTNQKIKILLITAAIMLVAGYAISPVTPIIKRICTSSFILVSGGWTIFALALSYWMIDMKKWDRLIPFFVIVGMNPLFIYLFAHLGGAGFIRPIVSPFTEYFLGWMSEAGIEVFTSLVVLFFLWYFCYWLYRKKIFFRI